MAMTTALANADPEKVSAWGKVIRDIGVPILMLIAMSFAMYQGGLWIGQNILVPTLKKNEELITSQMKSNEALLISLHQITESIKTQTESNKANTDSIIRMANDISAIRVATETTANDKTRLVDLSNQNQELLKEILKHIP